MSCVLILGASRSGTSLTAGLFAAHGVWFGPCIQPQAINRKGFFESTFLKQRVKGRQLEDFPDAWESWMQENGAGPVWGVKTGPEHAHLFERFNPVVVCCYRDMKAILDSRRRANWRVRPGPVEAAWRRMEQIEGAHRVHPDQFIQGEYSGILPAFQQLGVPFDRKRADDWVDPSMWGGNG